MEEICGGLIPASSYDNSEDNYHHPLMMMKNIDNGQEEEEEDQYYYPWLQTSSCISSILMSAATESHYDDHEKSGSIFSLQLEGADDHESSSSSNSSSGGGGGGDVIIREKISAHPLYPKLLEAYINFHKVGAPPEMANQLDKIVQENGSRKSTTVPSYCLGEDPKLDEFLETYCGVLAKYKLDLEKPYNEATDFLSNMESQLTNLCNNKQKAATTLGGDEDGGACNNDYTSCGGETEEQQCHGRSSEENEVKEKLLRKYGGYISTLRHEYFSKKKTNGKLPSDATHILQNWWSIHYNWPYPTEADKIALAETTGLDQKQINNWFINQRKRHWKPSDHNFRKPYHSGFFYPQ